MTMEDTHPLTRSWAFIHHRDRSAIHGSGWPNLQDESPWAGGRHRQILAMSTFREGGSFFGVGDNGQRFLRRTFETNVNLLIWNCNFTRRQAMVQRSPDLTPGYMSSWQKAILEHPTGNPTPRRVTWMDTVSMTLPALPQQQAFIPASEEHFSAQRPSRHGT